MNLESDSIEYKSCFSDGIKKTVIGFANTNGGTIFIGIADDGSVVGIDDTDACMLQTMNAIRDSIKPDVSLFTDCMRETRGSKKIVVITVQKGTARPYYLAGKGIRPEGVFIRQGSSTVPASESAILQMIKESSHDSYEEHRSLVQDLSLDDFYNEFSNAQIPIEKQQLKTLNLIGNDGLYTNLAVLFSSQCEHTIKVAVFQGTTKDIFKDRYEFSGSLFRQLTECYRLIDQRNSTRSTFNGLRRIDERAYPEVALREALLNAIVHRDYSFSASILISIFDDRIEFVTVGGLVNGMSKDDMLLGVSLLRNKHLANVFYRLKLIEAFGTGIPKIMESYPNANYTPKIEITDNAFKITLYNRHKATETVSLKNNDYIIKESAPLYVTDTEQKILDILQQKQSINRADIEQILGISQAMVVRHLKSLLTKGTIVKLGAGKNTRYVIR